jgi:hypothetical protein
MTTDDLPPLPAFADRGTKRAIRRGLIRTALLAVVWLIVGWFLLSIAGAGIQGALGRRDQLSKVEGTAWQVAHPEFTVRDTTSSIGGFRTAAGLDVRPILANGPGPGGWVRFRENLFGGVSRDWPDPESPASNLLLALHQGGHDLAAQEAKELRALPAPVRVAAVVDFAQPLDEAAYAAFLRDYPGDSSLAGAIALMSPGTSFGPNEHSFGISAGVYGWSPFLPGPERASHYTMLQAFRAWVAGLHDSDRPGLKLAGVDLSLLRRVAREGREYGVLVSQATPGLLLKLLADPRVAAVHPYDIQFAVEGGANS